jgi:hypothetical protein
VLEPCLLPCDFFKCKIIGIEEDIEKFELSHVPDEKFHSYLCSKKT